MLDLAGYEAGRNLGDAHAVELAVGEGAFLAPLVTRLLASCQRHDCQPSVRAYEVDSGALRQYRPRPGPVLAASGAGVPAPDAAALLDAWLVAAD